MRAGGSRSTDGCQTIVVDIVPVRRDGTGRLVAVGLVEVVDVDGHERWSLIAGQELPSETVDEVIDPSLHDSLGPDVHGQRSVPRRPNPDWAGPSRRSRRSEHTPAEINVSGPLAVEIRGKIAPQGSVHRFSWFLVTALPAQDAFVRGQRELLAAFLDAQGEPGLAGRLRQF